MATPRRPGSGTRYRLNADQLRALQTPIKDRWRYCVVLHTIRAATPAAATMQRTVTT